MGIQFVSVLGHCGGGSDAFGSEVIPGIMLLSLFAIVPLGLYFKMAKNKGWGIRLILISLPFTGFIAWIGREGIFSDMGVPTYVIYTVLQILAWTVAFVLDYQVVKRCEPSSDIYALRAIIWAVCSMPVIIDSDTTFLMPMLFAFVLLPWAPLVLLKSVVISTFIGTFVALGFFLVLLIGNKIRRKLFRRGLQPAGENAEWDKAPPAASGAAPRLGRRIVVAGLAYLALGLFLNLYVASNFVPDLNQIDASSDSLRELRYWRLWHVPALSHLGNDDFSILIYAAREENEAAVRYLLDRGYDPNSQDAEGNTALHATILYGDVGITELLLKTGSKATQPNLYGRTPLHLAAHSYEFSQCDEIVQLLVHYGADVNAKDSDGMTPLHLAAEEDDVALAEALLAHGADVNRKTGEGETALDLLDRESSRELRSTLTKAGAKTSSAMAKSD